MTFRKTAIAVCLLLVAAGCVSPRMRGDASTLCPSIARIEARGVLLVGSTGDYRPLTWRDPSPKWPRTAPSIRSRRSTGSHHDRRAAICKDLKVRDTGRVFCECPERCRNAVLAAEDAFGIEPTVRSAASFERGTPTGRRRV